MTALDKFSRLEAAGIWRPDRFAQRRNVIVSVGDTSLTIFDAGDTALGHWSLAAVRRRNPGEMPAVFGPGRDAVEELEIDDPLMVDAIDKVRRAIARRRPRRGRLRMTLLLGASVIVTAAAVLWLPEAIVRQAVAVAPPAARQAVGARLLAEFERLGGFSCTALGGQRSLDRLAGRLLPGAPANLRVLPGGVVAAEHLPGGYILLNRALVEDFDSPEVVAGFVLAERHRAGARDPLQRLLEFAGPVAAFRLLTSGALPDDVYRAHVLALATTAPAAADPGALLERFRAAGLSSRPYARALDLTGETVLPLIEADPFPQGTADPVLSDGDWVRLQGICGA